MSRSIVMAFPHDLSVPEAKKRINERFDLLKSQYVDKIGHAEVVRVGDVALIKVSALAQNEPANIRCEIHLPWLLAAMANKVEGLLQKNAKDTLLLGPKKV